jgi:rod shape-determining protein MreD
MKNNSFFYVGISLFFGLLLQIFPINNVTAFWRPQFLLMTTIYWIFKNPSQYGVGFAWLIGIILDIFAGEMYGRYAIGFSFCAYILMILSKRIQHFNLFYQALLIFFVVLLNQLLTVSVSLLYRPSWDLIALIAPGITSAFAWPILLLFLNKIFNR